MKPVHVTDYLWDASKYPAQSVCVFFGEELYLKHLAFRKLRDTVLGEEDAEFSLSRFDGNATPFKRILDEVSTTAMFGGSQRLVVVEDADSFVSKNREQLEQYAEKPSKSGVLLVLVNTFASNTRLYKKLADSGFLLDCSSLSEREVPSWVAKWAKHTHKVGIDTAAADLLVSLVGTELGMLDQELAKLALMVPEKGKIELKLVEEAVGSWRTKTTFEMLDLALAGKTAEAIKQLDALFMSGENPIGILAQVGYTLRKLAAATKLILESEKRGKKIPVSSALEQVGVKKFFLAKTESQLKALGRNRGAKLSQWLLQTDLDLKGASRSDPKLILESLIFRISDVRLKSE
ncbi:MAG: DNA polymerase III subunit delta [Thermoguttaceae bacterium]